MSLYSFTLNFSIDPELDVDALLDELYEAGCDDALVSHGLPGRISLAFDREAPDAVRAIQSAISNVKRAIPDAKLIEAGPDFVGLTDVADLIGVSRQNMRKLMLGSPREFPVPAHQGSAATWRLAELLAWLSGRGYEISRPIIDVAKATLLVNLARDNARYPVKIPASLAKLVA